MKGTIQIFLIDVDEVDGSAAIHETVDILGIENCFYTFDGAGHVPHQNYDTYYDTRAVLTGLIPDGMSFLEPICEFWTCTILRMKKSG